MAVKTVWVGVPMGTIKIDALVKKLSVVPHSVEHLFNYGIIRLQLGQPGRGYRLRQPGQLMICWAITTTTKHEAFVEHINNVSNALLSVFTTKCF